MQQHCRFIKNHNVKVSIGIQQCWSPRLSELRNRPTDLHSTILEKYRFPFLDDISSNSSAHWSSWLHLTFRCIIQESDSSIVLKNEDGNDIKLTLLKTPIDLAKLRIEHSEVTKKQNKQKNKRIKTKIQKTKVKDRQKESQRINKKGHTITVFNQNNDVVNNKDDVKKENQETGNKQKKILLLKDPISVNIEWGEAPENKSIMFNVKTVEGKYSQKKRKDSTKLVAWVENALVIFENSLVYPFIHNGNKYKCFVCSKTFLYANLLKTHTIEHDIKQLKEELTNRVKDQHFKVDVTCLQCRICLQTLNDMQNLKTHLKINHGKNIDLNLQDNLIPYKLGGDTFDCQVCGQTFLKLKLLIIHMSTHFNNYSCEVCGSVFMSVKLLKRHLLNHETRSFPCQKCDKVFSSSSKRSEHTRGVHLKRLPRCCPICPERFNSNYQRTKHLRIVHNQSTGLHRCESCSKEYDLKYHLLVHIRKVHLQERNQECHVCKARFFSKSCLSRHMVIHTGEKKFKCQICGKAYARKKSLIEHARSHEAGTSYQVSSHEGFI